MLKAGRSRVRVPMRSLNFFNLPSSHSVTLASTQPLTEPSARVLLGGGGGGEGQSARKADNLTAISDHIFLKMCRSLDVSQSYGPLLPVTRIALPFLYLRNFLKLKSFILQSRV
jgi:hypothetical protein